MDYCCLYYCEKQGWEVHCSSVLKPNQTGRSSRRSVYCTKPLVQILYFSNTSNLMYHLCEHHSDKHAEVYGASKVSRHVKGKCLYIKKLFMNLSRKLRYCQTSMLLYVAKWKTSVCCIVICRQQATKIVHLQ